MTQVQLWQEKLKALLYKQNIPNHFQLASNILVYNTEDGTWSKSDLKLAKPRAYHTSAEVPVTMFDSC